MSRIPQAGSRSGIPKRGAVVPAGFAPAASSSSVQPASKLQRSVFQQALTRTAQEPKQKVRASGTQISRIAPPTVKTKRGPEQVIQQATMERTVQRTPAAQYISRTVTGLDVDPSGIANRMEINLQEIDPAYATESRGVNETVSVTSSVSVTAGGKQHSKIVKKRTIKAPKFMPKVNMNPQHVNRLIQEEAEDVDNTLRILPPDLISASVEKAPLRKKLHKLRINSNSMGLLEQSVMHPAPTADEVDVEAPPEVYADLINAVEQGATPTSAPTHIFNTLFPDVTGERIDLSSVAPGPLADLVIPTSNPHEATEEVLNEQMEKTVLLVQDVQELPKDDICVRNNILASPRTPKGSKVVPTMVEEEIPPWEDTDIANLSILVGGFPLSPEEEEQDDLELFEKSMDGTLDISNVSQGIDYFLDAESHPYENKVHLRGSRVPDWFPGYMFAFPHHPELIKVSKSPSAVLHAAWKAVQPQIFPDSSIVYA